MSWIDCQSSGQCLDTGSCSFEIAQKSSLQVHCPLYYKKGKSRISHKIIVHYYYYIVEYNKCYSLFLVVVIDIRFLLYLFLQFIFRRRCARRIALPSSVNGGGSFSGRGRRTVVWLTCWFWMATRCKANNQSKCNSCCCSSSLLLLLLLSRRLEETFRAGYSKSLQSSIAYPPQHCAISNTNSWVDHWWDGCDPVWQWMDAVVLPIDSICNPKPPTFESPWQRTRAVWNPCRETRERCRLDCCHHRKEWHPLARHQSTLRRWGIHHHRHILVVVDCGEVYDDMSMANVAIRPNKTKQRLDVVVSMLLYANANYIRRVLIVGCVRQCESLFFEPSKSSWLWLASPRRVAGVNECVEPLFGLESSSRRLIFDSGGRDVAAILDQ